MKIKFYRRISFKYVISFALLGILVFLITFITGYKIYENVIYQTYYNQAEKIGEIASLSIDTDSIERYYQTNEIDDAYIAMSKKLDQLFSMTETSYLYVYYPTVDGEIVYFYEAKSPNSGNLPAKLNDKWKINGEKNASVLLEVYRSGNHTTERLKSNGTYGYNATAVIPLINSENKCVALLNVDIPMDLIDTALVNYLVVASVVSLLVMILLIVCFIFYFKHIVIKPIVMISDATYNFVCSNNEFPKSISEINTQNEIQMLADSIIKMKDDIHTYIKNLSIITAKEERVSAELKVATQIQTSMLPCTFPAYPERKEFDIYATMTPAKEVGGDFYDFFMIDDEHLAVVMADVSGKGIPAALFMMTSKTCIKDNVLRGKSPAEAFTDANNIMSENNVALMFVTAFMGILEISSGRFTYVNAGHNPPLIKKKDGSYQWLNADPGCVLAIMAGINYTEASVQLEKGDIFFTYTDGVTEALNNEKTLYSDERLIDTLNRNAPDKLKQLLEFISADVDLFAEGAEQADDITMLAMKYLGVE